MEFPVDIHCKNYFNLAKSASNSLWEKAIILLAKLLKKKRLHFNYSGFCLKLIVCILIGIEKAVRTFLSVFCCWLTQF